MWAKTYGRPSDPFLRIVETFELDGSTLCVRREVLERPIVQRINIRIGFEGPTYWPGGATTR